MRVALVRAAAVALAIVLGTKAAFAEIRNLRLEVRPVRTEAALRALQFQVVPTTLVTSTGKEIRIELPADVLFDFDKATIRNEAREGLQQAANILRAHPGAKVEFNGHADSKGSDAHNDPLSKRRARAVLD